MSDGNSGFKNLRAMFETQSAASSPEPRGRSPAKFNTDSTTPTPSKIRASFVSVEPSAQVITRDLGTTKGTTDGVNTPTAQRRESFSLSADPNDDTVAELKKEVTQEKEERENSTAVADAVPEEAVETRESSRAPVPIREVKSTMPNLGIIMKGSDFPEPQAAVEEKPVVAQDSKVEEPAEPAAAPEPASEDISNKLAALSLADEPAEDAATTETETHEAGTPKPVESEDKPSSSEEQDVPLPVEESPSTNATPAPEQFAEPEHEPTKAESIAAPEPEAKSAPEDVSTPVAAPQVDETVQDPPAQKDIEDVPTSKAVEEAPIPEAVEAAPTTEVTENAPTTKDTGVTEDTPAQQPAEASSTTPAVESAPAPEPVVESASTTPAAETAPSADVPEKEPVKKVTENTPPSTAESATATKSVDAAPSTKPVEKASLKGKQSVTSNASNVNGKTTQKPPAISTTRTAASKVASSKSPLPRSPGLARLPKTPTTPKPTIPTSSAKSPAPAKGPSRVAGSKDTTAPVKSSAAPKEPSKTTVTKDQGKTSLPAPRTARSSLLPSSSTASAVSKGKAPVVESKTSTARSSSVVSASKEPKAASAASVSKDAKEATKAHTTSPSGFKKPRPKSPTKPVGLPSRLTAPTAASSAKHGEEATQKVTRKPSTTSRPPQPKIASTTAAKKPASRASLAPSTVPSKRPESRASTTGGSSEGFLARMMRPTTSSASKTHDKPASPPRRGGSVRVAPKAKTGHESTVAKGKKKVVEVAHKAKEAVTNGHTDEHTTEESGPASADETTVAPSGSVEAEPQTENTASASEQTGDETTAPEAREITT